MQSGKILIFLFLFLIVNCFMSGRGHAQDKIRIGVPLFPTVSYPVFIAHEKGLFEKNGLKAEITRINSEPTTYQALISGDRQAGSGFVYQDASTSTFAIRANRYDPQGELHSMICGCTNQCRVNF